ncbi:MAG: sugar porter family MFS transporter [Sedimentisphaerales bacterium]|nr:sugar porter family MFS transporter [Sedimentisphaerales bacterium]
MPTSPEEMLDTANLDNNKRAIGYLVLICFVASLGGFLFGFDTAVISGTVEQVEAQFQLSKIWVGVFTSSALVGCIMGALGAGWIGDRFGRKPSLIIAAFLFFISAFGSTFPPNYFVLLPARFIGGVGVGIASVLAPMYISEFAPAKIRGRLVALYQLSIVIGILMAYFSNWQIRQYAADFPDISAEEGLWHFVLVAQSWRGMFGAEMIPAGLFVLLLFTVPESPRWLVKAGQQQKALSLLQRLEGFSAAQTEFDNIKASLAFKPGAFSELFKPGLKLALLVGVMLSVFGQMSGVNIVIYYGPTILKQAGFPEQTALQVQVFFGLVNLVFTIVALFIIDRFGRRPLLIGGMAVVALSMLSAGLIQAFVNIPGKLIVVVLGIYMASVALSICAVIWVLTPEIFPNRVRARACSIATFANWGTNAFSAQFFPWYVDQSGMAGAYFTFGIICTIAVIFYFKFVPETKGKTLEDIEKLWTPK